MNILKIISAFFSRLIKGGSSGTKNSGSSLVDFYSASGTKKSLSRLIGEAIDQKRKPVLFFHADWCGGSVKFKVSLNDPRMREALKDATLILIDSDADSENLSQAYHIRHVPAFILVNRDGSSVKVTTGAAWGDDVIENMAPVMKQFLA